MNEMILASTPDYIDPAIAFPLAIVLWLALAVYLRRDYVKRVRAERVERERMLAEYEASLKRSGWGE